MSVLVMMFATSLVARPAAAQHEMHDMHADAPVPTSMAGPLGVDDRRHASGTAWLPDDSPMSGAMRHRGGWMFMAHGQAFLQFVSGTGDRGDRQMGSLNWGMGMARHALAGGQFTARVMLSAERLTTGLCGYPDIIQTGSVCGAAVRDLQHPHDLFMELGADYRRPLGERVAIELYGGASGEPALGPAAYPHRLSAAPNPTAPIAHHWLDITHVSFGVITGGLYGRRWKTEASLFNGRHGDDLRYGFDLAAMDSVSARVWWLPGPRWSLQVSTGRLLAPEGHSHAAKAANVTTIRTTASATYHRRREGRSWASTVAWGSNAVVGRTTSAVLAETTLQYSARNTLFGRGEVVEETAADLKISAIDDETYRVAKVQAGYLRTVGRWRGLEGGLGAAVSMGVVPERLRFVYSRRAPAEVSVFFRIGAS